MKTLAIGNEKGGVGKTSTAGNLSYALMLQGYRVLMVDNDPQGSLTDWYHKEDLSFELADYFASRDNLSNFILPIRERLDLVPTAKGGDLREYAETKLYRDRFAHLDLVKAAELLRYDFLVFDMNPNLSTLERSAIAASNEVLLVLEPEYFAYEGVHGFIKELTRIREENRSDVILNKIVLSNKNESFRGHKYYTDQLSKQDLTVYQIPQDRKVAECLEVSQSIHEYAPKSKAAAAYNNLAKGLVYGRKETVQSR